MNVIEPYPDCLCRPDADGHVQTRTTETEVRYRARYKGMIRTLCKQTKCESADAYDLALDLGERAPQYAKNALKQYHAAIRQNLRDRWDAGSITADEVVEIDALLRSQQPMPIISRKMPASGILHERAKDSTFHRSSVVPRLR